MEEICLRDIRSIQIELLSVFHSFCEKHQLTYYLSNGTLLGAVKYKGYIPWDDDIDVCMPRPDYQRLIQLWDDSSSTLFSHEKQPEYFFPFAKLSNNKTVLIEENVDNGCQVGVNIDVFPLDGFGNSEEESYSIYKKMEKYRKKLSMAKLLPKPDDGLFKRIAKRILSCPQKMVGSGRLCRKIDEFAKRNSYEHNRYIGNAVWGFYSPGEAHERKCFDNKICVDFEGKPYYAPAGYDLYLKKLYGSYEIDPPPEKQVSHHRYKAFYNSDDGTKQGRK